LLHVGTFAFADSLPSYWEGDPTVSGFTPFTEAEKEAFRSALQAWNIVDNQNPGDTLTEIAPGANNDAAEGMVFKSDISDTVMVLPNNFPSRDSSQKLVDFIADSSSPLFDDLTPGNQGYFEIVRGVGKLFGYEDDDEQPRTESLYGQRFGDDFDAFPFPSTPLPRDLIGRRVFDVTPTSFPAADRRFEIQFGNTEDNRYFLSPDTPTFSTIADADGVDWISASGSERGSTIDLHPLAPNFIGTNGNQRQTYLIDFESDIENGVGGKFADSISGNRLDNLLIGNAGNDVLNGRAGFDRLYGGAGSDEYIFEIGDGTDIINEQGFGGRDSLKLVGFDSFDSLEDLTFQKLGNDLLIRLRLDGNEDHVDDSIRIRNMGDNSSRVESLSLDNIFGQNLLNISLVSAFSESEVFPKRMELTGGSDAFGPLVRSV